MNPEHVEDKFKCFMNYFTNDKRITVSYWCDLAKSLFDRDPNPMKSLAKDSKFGGASRERFELAGISSCHYS